MTEVNSIKLNAERPRGRRLPASPSAAGATGSIRRVVEKNVNKDRMEWLVLGRDPGSPVEWRR